MIGDKSVYAYGGLDELLFTYLRNFSTSRTIMLYSLLYWVIMSVVGTKSISPSSSSEDEKLAVSMLRFILFIYV